MTIEAAAERLDVFLAQAQARALRLAQIATRSRDDALDIVQDAMLQLARSYGRRPAAEWPPLFYRILENKIRDWQRRQKVKNRLFFRSGALLDEEDAPPPMEQRIADPSIPDAAQRLMQNEALARLEIALRQLPARQRQAFTLRVWEGLSTDDTARVMACSDGSVKTHLARALSALRAKLGDAWSLDSSS